MRPETKAILKKIAYYLWDGILGAEDNEDIFYPWIRISKEEPSLSIRLTPPSEKFDDYRKAMNAFQAYSVLSYTIGIDDVKYTGGENAVDIIKELDFSEAKKYFIISRLDTVRFIDFCHKFEIKLQDVAKFHTARLIIDNDYNPVIIIDGKRYEYKRLYGTNTAKIFRLALFYSDVDLTITKLNDLSDNPKKTSKALGGDGFHNDIKENIWAECFNRREYPKVFEFFFDIQKTYIRGIKEIQIDDEDMLTLVKESKGYKKK